jgi:hypothetical protein
MVAARVTLIATFAVIWVGCFSAVEGQDTVRSDAQVAVPVGYAEGAVWVDGDAQGGRFIQLAFGSGLLIGSAWARTAVLDDYSRTGMVLIDTSTVDSAGYRRCGQVVQRDTTYGTYTSGSPDTNWTSTPAIPDSLLPLDSFCTYCWLYPIQPPLGNTGRWFGYSDSYFNPPTDISWCLTPPGHNTIMYARCSSGRTMKLQVDSMVVRDLGEGNTRCSTYRIRWAVDSAGNGLFGTSPTAVRETRLPAREALGTSLRLRQYDIRGRALSSTATGPSRNSAQRPRALVVAGGRLVWRE